AIGVFPGQDPGQLAQLGDVPGREDQRVIGHDGLRGHMRVWWNDGPFGNKERASCCSLVSSPQPATARSSSWPSRSRLNGSCSAVPWISTKSPLAVHTTFMSVCAATSSS